MRRYREIFTTLCFLFAYHAHVSLAQELPYHRYTMRDGLVSDYITCLYQDSRQYLWIGTTEGISVFDGFSFRNYTPADGIPFPSIDAIIEDRRSPGTMWVGTNGKGVCKIADGKVEPVFSNTPLATKQIFSLAEDCNGTIWCGTGEGIYLIRNNKVLPFHAEISFGGIFALQETANDSMTWFASAKGLFLYSEREQSLRQILDNSVTNLSVDKNQNLWACTNAGEVIEFRGGQAIFRQKIANSGISFILNDMKGNVWGSTGITFQLAPNNNGKGTVKWYTGSNSFPGDNLSAGLVDKKNNIWFGGATKGIIRLMGSDVCRFTSDSVIQKYNNATAVCDCRGHLWVAARSRLWEMWNDGDGWRRVVHSLPPDVKEAAIVQDAHGRLWIGSDISAIHCYELHPRQDAATDIKLARSVSLAPHAGSPRICFIIDKDGMLWYSTVDSGVFVIDPDRGNAFVRHLDTRNGLPDNSVRALFQDNAGNIWFGGYAQGLSILPYSVRLTGNAHPALQPEALLDNGIRAITQDAAGRIWIGLRYGGVAEIQNDSVYSYTVKDGLLSNGVWTLAFDSSGRMLIGTQLGLGYCDVRRSMLFTRNTDFTGTSVYSCGAIPGGYDWFVTSDGLTLYNDASEGFDTAHPDIAISQFQLNGKEMRPAPDMRFAYDQNNLVIDYVGVDLKDARAIRYEYRMVGADEDWRPATFMREVTYAALKPGSYRFEVRAITANGTASAHPALMEFTITPPYWQRWWFVVIAGCAIVAAAVFVIRTRVRRLLEIERIRSRIATDLHDDIGSGLTRIAIFSDVASRQISALRTREETEADDPLVAASSVQKVGNIARELVDTMSDVVWSIDPKQDSMQGLVSRIRTYAFELCEAKNITLSFEIGRGVEQVRLSSEIKRGILLLVKEALTNVVRHSGCSAAQIGITLDRQSLYISIMDNGKGFDASAGSFGNGLMNMRKRVDKIGGKFSITSSPGAGTRLNAAIPVSEKTAHLFS